MRKFHSFFVDVVEKIDYNLDTVVNKKCNMNFLNEHYDYNSHQKFNIKIIYREMNEEDT